VGKAAPGRSARAASLHYTGAERSEGYRGGGTPDRRRKVMVL
jgi:hypothetical protein